MQDDNISQKWNKYKALEVHHFWHKTGWALKKCKAYFSNWNKSYDMLFYLEWISQVPTANCMIKKGKMHLCMHISECNGEDWGGKQNGRHGEHNHLFFSCSFFLFSKIAARPRETGEQSSANLSEKYSSGPKSLAGKSFCHTLAGESLLFLHEESTLW